MFVDPPLLDAALRGLILAVAGLIWVIVLVRANGLRSFSKMTNFDFAITVAIGSLLAGLGRSMDAGEWIQAAMAMLALFVAQFATAWFRERSSTFQNALDNDPCLLMRDGVADQDAMTRHRVTQSDLTAKLREANVLKVGQVRAVVLESTGDISVLHGEHLEKELLSGVK